MTDDLGVPSNGVHAGGVHAGGVHAADSETRIGPGSRVAGYVIEAQVGAGGMAVVFRAKDAVLGRMTALKVLAPRLAADAEFRARFLRESRAIATVDQPHILTVYAAGEADGVLYIATRFVPGGDLAGLMRRAGGRLDPSRAIALIAQVASALDAAHAAGLVHRDVKPANVLIDYLPNGKEHAYLSDFGLSKAASSDSGLTAPGMFMGTPDYCPPEQITGRYPVTDRSDQYSLACVAFSLLAGRVPFARRDTIAVLYAHANEPVPSVTAIRGDLPAAADAVLARGMAKDPAERYASCSDFAIALVGAVAPAPDAPGRPADRPHRPRRGKTVIIGGTAAGAVVIASVVALALAHSGHSASSTQAGVSPGASRSAGPKPKPTAAAVVTTVAVRLPGGDDLSQPVYSPDGTLLAGLGVSNTSDIYVVNAVTGMPVRTLKLPANVFSPQLAFTPDDKTLTGVDGSVPGGVFQWDLSTGQETTLVPSMAATGGAADSDTAVISADGSTMAILDSARDGVDVWNLSSGTKTAELTDPDGATVVTSGSGYYGAISLDENGSLVSVADPAGNVYVWNVSSRQLTATLHYDYNTLSNSNFKTDPATLSPDGKLITINFAASGPVSSVWSIATRASVTPGGSDWPRTGAAVLFSANGQVIVTNRDGGTAADLWNAASGAHLASVGFSAAGPGDGLSITAIAPDGRELFGDDSTGHNYIWRVTY
jgi:serine/threonine-protein kinase